MQLFHTSPTEIRKVTNDGMFGSFMFFSSRVYKMSDESVFVYSVEIDDDSIIEAGHIYYDDGVEKIQAIIEEVMAWTDVDSDTALDLICERENVYDVPGIKLDQLSDLAWDIQYATARAARALGYRGVKVSDEQGTAYMIDMFGREKDLVRE